jgi:hypothetical protein
MCHTNYNTLTGIAEYTIEITTIVKAFVIIYHIYTLNFEELTTIFATFKALPSFHQTTSLAILKVLHRKTNHSVTIEFSAEEGSSTCATLKAVLHFISQNKRVPGRCVVQKVSCRSGLHNTQEE